MTKPKTRTHLDRQREPAAPRPRILLEDPEKSYHASHRVTDQDLFDNRLIFGDNLLALKALEQDFTGKIKCVYIDPPYNTGSAFVHYDDGVQHSLWLSLMQARLEILWRLLDPNGSLWISIDDDEMPYLRVLADELLVVISSSPSAYGRNATHARIGRQSVTCMSTSSFMPRPRHFKEQRNKVPLTDEQANLQTRITIRWGVGARFQ